MGSPIILSLISRRRLSRCRYPAAVWTWYCFTGTPSGLPDGEKEVPGCGCASGACAGRQEAAREPTSDRRRVGVGLGYADAGQRGREGGVLAGHAGEVALHGDRDLALFALAGQVEKPAKSSSGVTLAISSFSVIKFINLS